MNLPLRSPTTQADRVAIPEMEVMVETVLLDENDIPRRAFRTRISDLLRPGNVLEFARAYRIPRELR